MVNKEVREIAKAARKAGLAAPAHQRRPGARRAARQDQERRQVPSTPGGRRWKENLTAELRKAGADL
jgi:hypothetical protein